MVNCSIQLCNAHVAICEIVDGKMEGACSEVCKESPERRAYDGSGYYSEKPSRIQSLQCASIVKKDKLEIFNQVARDKIIP